MAKGLTVLPGAMALAATPDPVASVERASAIAATELRAAGVSWDLAPVADVNDEPKNSILLNRSFGSDPKRVGELAAAWVRGHSANGVLSCAKHFPGHGSTSVDPHTGLPDLTHDRARLDRIELVPFKAAIAAAVPAVMTAHIVMKAIDAEQPATLSTKVLEGILRTELGFDGVIVTDDLEMDALRSFGATSDVAVRSIAAGADHALFRFDEEAQKAGHRMLVDAFTSGRIPIARLESAVRRVLAAKSWLASVASGEPKPDYAANGATANEPPRHHAHPGHPGDRRRAAGARRVGHGAARRAATERVGDRVGDDRGALGGRRRRHDGGPAGEPAAGGAGPLTGGREDDRGRVAALAI